MIVVPSTLRKGPGPVFHRAVATFQRRCRDLECRYKGNGICVFGGGKKGAAQGV